jgi:hypothetical protein
MAMAGMIGSPVATLPGRSIAVGVEGGIINRELVFETGPTPDIDMMKIMFRGTYGILDRVNVSLVLGMANDDFRVEDFSGTSDLKFLGESAFALGGGFKLTLSEFPLFRLGGGAQYEQFTLESRNSTTPPAAMSDASFDWSEFLFFLGVHLQEVPYFVPYGGVYLTVLNGELSFSSPTIETINVEENQSIGLFYGGHFMVWKEFVVGTELHLIAENSIAFSLNYSF